MNRKERRKNKVQILKMYSKNKALAQDHYDQLSNNSKLGIRYGDVQITLEELQKCINRK